MELQKVIQPFFLFETCEDKYEYFDYIMEFWAVLTSLLYAIPYFYIKYINKNCAYETNKMCLVFAIVSIFSSLYHIYLHPLTQFFDQASIVLLLHSYIILNKIPFYLIDKILAYCFLTFGIAHSGIMALCLCVYFNRIFLFLYSYGKKYNRKGIFLTFLTLSLAGLFLGADLTLCKMNIFEHFHSLWHIGTFAGFVFGVIEMDYFNKNLKEFALIKGGFYKF